MRTFTYLLSAAACALTTPAWAQDTATTTPQADEPADLGEIMARFLRKHPN